MPRKRKRRRVLSALAVSILIAGSMTACAWSPKAPDYPVSAATRTIVLPHRFRNGQEHDAALSRVGHPYILSIVNGKGALEYYGATHSTDRNDSQIADIEKHWSAFRPTVALCEGRRSGFLLGWPWEQLSGLPEPALVHKLARRDDVALYSLEPPYEEEVAALITTWPAEQVAMYFTLRVYWAEAGGKADDGLAEHLRRKRTDVNGLRGSLANVADIDRVWRRNVSATTDWRTLTSEPEGIFLTAISDASRRVRGEHMARVLIELVRKGERVFAVVGSGHVIRQEWALRAALGAAPAVDQPATTLPR